MANFINVKKIFFTIIIFNFLNSTTCISKEIPIIVIAPGKSYQSKNIVGSDVVVIERKKIQQSNEFFLGDILSKNLNGMNYFQSGGYGTTSGIQLRGLPKRYSTVYIDGVKMSDPSSPTNDYYFNHIMSSSIDRVEILKGTQTSLYGSGAIAGTINIFSKRGKEGHHKNINLSTASKNTKNLDVSFNGKNGPYDYYVNFNNFSSGGISAMNDNDENDKYKNEGIVANFGYKMNDQIRLESNFRYTDSYLEYDEVAIGRADNNNTDDHEASYSLKLIKNNKNNKNIITYNRTHFKRSSTDYSGSNDIYWGYRDSINFLGEYNFNYDTKIVYGFDNEFELADFNTYYTGYKNTKNDEAIYSQYLDLQFRPAEKIYSTIGFRRDDHTTAGVFETGRFTIAFKPDNTTKFRSSLGSGIRFGSLDEYHYEQKLKNLEDLKPEKSISFDMGFDKSFKKSNLDLGLTFFHIEYDNNMLNWASNTDGGKQAGGYAYGNNDGKVKSLGMEITSKWKPKKNLDLNIGYTITDAYDGTTCDDPNYADLQPSFDKCIDEMPVRVPRHAINASINNNFNNVFNTTILFKYASERRDFGNGNNEYNDRLLDDYFTLDFFGRYKIYNSYNLYFSLTNLFDYNYEEAYQYSTMGRSFNFGLKRIY